MTQRASSIYAALPGWSFTRKHQKDDRNGTWYMILQRFISSSVFGLNTYIKLDTTAISMSFSVPGLVSCLQIFLLARLCVSGCETGACHDLRVVPSLCCDMWPPRPSSRPLIGHKPAYWPLIGQQPGHCCGNMLSPRSTQIIPNGEHKLQSKRKRWGKLCFENIYFSCDHKHKLGACAVSSGLGYNEELNAALLHQ